MIKIVGHYGDVLFEDANREWGSYLDLSGKNLVTAQLSGKNLHAVDLAGSNLTRANLRNVSMSCVYWRGVNFTGADLSRARIHGSVFIDCDFTGCSFDEADVVDVRFEGSTKLDGAKFIGARLARLNAARVSFRRARFDWATLTSSSFVGSDFEEANLQDVFSLFYSEFTRAKVRGVRWPAPQTVLGAYWPIDENEQLVADLMKYDSLSHPDPELFDLYASDGVCPYEDAIVKRAAFFNEYRSAWKFAKVDTPYNLFRRVVLANCADSDFHEERLQQARLADDDPPGTNEQL